MVPLDDGPSNPPTDLELLRAWQAGHRLAGELLFERYYPVVARFFHNKVTSPSTREDLIQDTFDRCVRSADRFQGRAPFRTYLLGIAHRALLNHYRELRGPRNHDALGSTSIEAMDPSPSTDLATRQERHRLLQILRELPMDQQILLELKYWERLKLREIAAVLDLPESTVKNRLHRARISVQERLEGLGASPLPPATDHDALDEWSEELHRMLLELLAKDPEDRTK